MSRIDDVQAMHLDGLGPQEIADRLGLSLHTINEHLVRMRAKWKAPLLRQLDAKITDEVRHLNEVERAAWEAWENSCRIWSDVLEDMSPLKRRMYEGLLIKWPEGVSPPGDPRYLGLVLRVIDRRCRLLGLDVNPRKGIDVVEEIRKMANSLPAESRRADMLAAADAVERARRVVANMDPDEADSEA
jgi:hypothetical protein